MTFLIGKNSIGRQRSIMPSRQKQKAKVEHVLRVLRAVRKDNFTVPDNRSTPAFLRSFRLVGK